MLIPKLLSERTPTFSFEFFPPKTDTATDALIETAKELQSLDPSFVSITYGAGGSTRDLTHDLVVRLQRDTSMVPLPHLTCVCHSEEDIRRILSAYAAAGVQDILALGGDPPAASRERYVRSEDRFRYASDLIDYIRTFEESKGTPRFGIGVAGFPEGHPATPNRLDELDHLKHKVDQGADFIITQLFFDNHDFLDFRDRCRLAGIEVPILAGIMPVTTQNGLVRLASLAQGAHFPAALLGAVQECKGDQEAVYRVGTAWSRRQCTELLANGVDGIHFYTLNRSRAALDVLQGLR